MQLPIVVRRQGIITVVTVVPIASAAERRTRNDGLCHDAARERERGEDRKAGAISKGGHARSNTYHIGGFREVANHPRRR
jgi:hypothetical protein